HAPAASGDGGAGPVTTNFGVNAFPTYCLIGPDNTMLNRDIWPIAGVETFEGSFPVGFEPEVIECSLGVSNTVVFDFNIYPSVSNGNININLPNAAASSVAVFNTMGQQVFANKYSEKNITLNLQVAAGVYMVKVTADNNSVTKRIIVE